MSNTYSEEELKKLGSCGTNVQIDRSVILINPQNIHIGNNVRIDAFCFLSASAGIFIGNHVHIAHYTQLSAGGGKITLQDFCGLSSRVSLFTSTDDYSEGWLTNPTIPDKFKKVKKGDITLEKHVIVGCGSVILPKVVLREGSSVGALSLVNKTVPAFTVVAGNPLHIISKRDKNQLLSMEKKFYEECK